MATASQPLSKTSFVSDSGIWSFFKRELAPTPGRLSWATRVAITSAVMLLIGEACRSEMLFIALFIPLTLPRDSPQQTWAAAKGTVITAWSSSLISIMLVLLVVDLPWVRVLVLALAIFFSFILAKGLRQPAIGVLSPIIATFALTRPDTVNSAEIAITTAFWMGLMMSAGALVATAVEFLFPHPGPEERVTKGIVDRLKAAASVFKRVSGEELSDDGQQRVKSLGQLAVAGTSSLRKLLPALSEKHFQDENYLLRFGAFLNGLDIFSDEVAQLSKYKTADFNTQQKTFALSLSKRCEVLAGHIQRRAAVPPEEEGVRASAGPVSNLGHGQLLLDTSAKLDDLWRIRSGHSSISPEPTGTPDTKKSTPPPGPFFSTDNIHFAFKVSLASMLCYLIYNGLDWQGLNPSMLTCYLVADDTIGSTFRKLTLRLTGATVGGLLFGIGGISLVLSHLSNVAELTLYVAVVFFVSGWVASGSPRLSYAGSQIGLAFGLVALMHPVIPSQIVEPRDRFVAVLLGGVAMWLVFTRLWPVDTLAVQKRGIAGLIRIAGSLTLLAEEDLPANSKIAKMRELRESINQGITKAEDQGDTADYEGKHKEYVQLALSDCLAKTRDLLMLGITDVDLSTRAVNPPQPSDKEAAERCAEYLCYLAEQMAEGSQQSLAELNEKQSQFQAAISKRLQPLDDLDNGGTEDGDNAFTAAKTHIWRRRNDLLRGLFQGLKELAVSADQLSAKA